MGDFRLLLGMFVALGLGAAAADMGPNDVWLGLSCAAGAVAAMAMAIRSAA